MAGHVRLKNEFTEDEKYHNLMTWLIWCYFTDKVAEQVFNALKAKETTALDTTKV